MRRLHRQNERGVAMLIALVTLFILSVVAGELVYQSTVYTSVVFKARDQLRATLLARSGLRLSLLQLKAARKAKAKAKDLGFGENTGVVDKIWQTQLILPPPSLPGLSAADSAAIDAFGKSLGFDGSVSITILGENGRMSLNQLVWPLGGGKSTPGAETTAAKGSASGGDVIDPSNPFKTPTTGGSGSGAAMTKEQRAEAMKKTRESFVEMISALLENKRRQDDAFRDRYPNLSGETLVGHLLAWMDPETKQDGNNRDKTDYYSRAEPAPYAVKDAPFASETELHMVQGFDETIAKLISENFTVQTVNSLDVNKAALSLIHALIPELTPDALEQIGKRRTDDTLGGPFANAGDFWGFVNGLGRYEDAKKRFEERGIRILEEEKAFRATIVARSGLAQKTWVADLGGLPPKLDPVQGENPPPPQPPTPPPTPSTSTGTSTNTSTSTTADDTDSLGIVYLKAE